LEEKSSQNSQALPLSGTGAKTPLVPLFAGFFTAVFTAKLLTHFF
jgi:hypothetical protein